MTASENQIVVYQPNETVRLDVRLENETVWLTQSQMATLFGCSTDNVGLHLKNIYSCGELDKGATTEESSVVQIEGQRKVSRKVCLYNLDAIISVGYRVNSVLGVKFRQWATRVLKEYLLRGYSVNARMNQLEDKVDRRLAQHDREIVDLKEKVDFFVQTKEPPLQSIFYQNKFWDAKSLLIKFIRRARKELIVIDAYPGVATLDMLAKRGRGVRIELVTHSNGELDESDYEAFGAQCGKFTKTICGICHDRFIIIDQKEIFWTGASLKDAGRLTFAAAKMGAEAIPGLLESIRKATSERREYGKGKKTAHRLGVTGQRNIKKEKRFQMKASLVKKGVNTRILRVNSFFAGIGGFDIGFEKAGFNSTFLCEVNSFCNSVLKTHWPNVPMFGDIGKLDAAQIPDADVWCGGFPCQDISVARGALERKGLGGVRSGLFYQYANLIEARRPKVVVIENVEGLFNSNKGRDFGMILQRLTRLGYAVSWRLFNSRYFGVPQSRARVYICCWKDSVAHSMRVMFENKRTPKPKNERTDFITESNPAKTFPKVPKVAYCLAATSGRHTGTDWSRTYVSCADGVRRMTPKEYERLQGFPDLWTIPSGCDADNDDVDTLRYTALGNAVSVPVVEWVANRIKKELAANESALDLCKVTEYVPELRMPAVDIDLEATDFTDETKEFKWPKSGLAWRGHYVGGNIPPSPVVPVRSELFDITEKGKVGTRYYLSPNACKGILRRVDGQGRKLFSPLRTALEKETKKIKGA